MSRRRWTPSVLELALLLLVVGAAGWGLRSLGETVERHVVARREEAIGALFELANRNFSYGAIAPSLLRALEIRDLVIYSDDTPDQPVVSIRRLRLRYSLTRLIASRDPIASLREVQLANSHVEVDLERDQELMQVLQELGLMLAGTPAGAAGGGVALPPVTLAGANLGVTLQGLGFRLQVDDLFFRVQAGDELQVTARGQARAWPAAAGGGFGAGPPLDARFRVTGAAAGDLSAAELAVSLNELTSDRFRAAPLELQVAFAEDRLQVVRSEDRVPLELAFSHQPSSGRSELAVAATGLSLADVAAFSEPHPLAGLLRGAAVSGTARWSHAPGRGMEYEARLTGHLTAGAAGAGDASPAAVTLTAHGDDTRVAVSRFTLERADGGLEFAGDVMLDTLLPQGDLAIRSLQVRPGEQLRARAALRRGADGAMALRSERLALADTEFRRFDLDLRPATAAPLTYHYQVRAELQQEAANFINGEGTVSLGGARRLDLAASVESLNAGLLYRLATPPEARQGWLTGGLDPLLVSGAIDAVTDFATASVRAPALQVRDTADPGNRLQLNLTANERGLRLEQAAARWLGLELRAAARLARTSEAVDLAAELTVNDVPYELRLTHTPGRGLTASGSHDLQFAADYGRGAVTFRGSTAGFPVPLPFAAAPLEATLAFRGRFAGPQEWSLQSDAVTLRRLPFAGQPDLLLEAGVQAESGEITLQPLLIRDDASELRGRGSIVLTAEDTVAAQLEVAAADRQESYAATVDLAAGRVDAAAQVRGLPLRRLGTFPFSGNLNAAVTAAGPWPEVAWQAAVDLRDGRLNDESLGLTATLERAAGGGVAVRDLTFDLLSHRLRAGRGAYQPDSGRLEFAADYAAEYFGDPVAARLQLEAYGLAAGAGRSLDDALAGGVTGDLQVEQIRVADAALDPWRLRLAAQRPAAAAETGAAAEGAGAVVVRFNGGPRDAFAGEVSTAGRFALRVQRGAYPLHGSASGTVTGGHLNAEVAVADADAQLINEVLSQAPVALEAGTASGRLRVAGPINDPDFWGQLRLAGGVATSPMSPLRVGPFRALITLDEKLVSIAGFAADGPEPLPIVVSGTATVERWAPAIFALELTTGAAGVPINHRFGPLVFEGMAAGALAVTGDAGAVTISGDLEARSADISLADTDPVSGAAEQVRVDLAVVTGRSVEFTWPSAQFPVVRLQLAPSRVVQIGYDGLTGEVSVQGELAARGGDLIYFDRQFLLREGQIRFGGDDSRIDPRLVVRAEARERDPQGEPVRLILQADTTLSQFGPNTVRLSSDPPQSALLLDALVRGPLAQGDRPDAGAAAGLSAAAFSGELMTQVALLRPVERALREALGVDMVSIRSQFVQTLAQDVVGASVSGGVVPGTGNPLDNTSLSFGKYLGSDLFLTMLLRLDTSVGQPDDDLPLLSDVELGLEWATPFFMLEWSFLPRNLNTLFVTDNTVSLRWRWSY